MSTIKVNIANALASALSTVTELKTINTNRILISIHDFNDHEIPAVQLFSLGESIVHERGRALRSWSMTLELIMKSLVTGSVTQYDLWDLGRKLEQALWLNPNLKIPGVVHLVYTGNINDIHTMEPYYILQQNFDVLYYDNLTGAC